MEKVLVKQTLKTALLCLVSLIPAWGDQIAVSKFRGIDNNSNSAIIGPEFAQDLLNVEINPGGASIKKRPGYGLYKTLSTSQALHGGYHFFDSSGNDVTVWGSSTSLYGIVADATPTQIVSSATLNSTWDCADSQGSAYCVTSNRDAYIKTNGATLQSWNTSPLGTMVETTPDRVVVAGVSGNLSTIYHSAANSFLSYTVGPLPTDAFTEVIAAPGSKLTHLRWACGKLLWWKDQSFGYESFDDQYALNIKIISDNIGTFDNTSAVDPGGNVWFRGQDGHIWRYDCAGLTKESIEITPLVQASGRRTSDLWTQTSQSDWQAGSSSPTAPTQPLSFTISAGDVIPGSFTVTENSSTSWNSGTASNTSVGTSSISLSVNSSGDVTNNSMESGSVGSTPSNWTGSGYLKESSDITVGCLGGFTGIDGTYFAEPATGQKTDSTPLLTVQILDATSSAILDSTSFSIASTNCTFTTKTVSISASNKGKRVKFKFLTTDSSGVTSDVPLQTSESYILGGDFTFLLAVSNNGTGFNFACIDKVTSGSSTITTGSFTSQPLNTGLPYSFLFSSATWNTNGSTPTFVIQKSTASNGKFYEMATSTNTNTQLNQQYFRYVTTMTVLATDPQIGSISGVNFVAMSSGTFYSQLKNAPSLSAWSTFNPTYSNGNGSHAFYIRVGNSSWGTLSPTAPQMTALAPNALVASTFTAQYFQIIDSFTITSATDTVPILNDFTVNWFDGNASDQAYMLYFDNAIWADVSEGVGVSSNTYIFKRDLINDGWLLYNFGAGGMLVQNNHLFFGDVSSTGKIFEFDSGHSDNGTAINAFWRSKDFTGPDPFMQSALTKIDVFAKKDTGSTLTATYALDTSTTTTNYTISLSSSIATIIQNRKSLPAGKQGYMFNLQLGDSSTSSDWELLGYRISFDQLPWRPSTP